MAENTKAQLKRALDVLGTVFATYFIGENNTSKNEAYVGAGFLENILSEDHGSERYPPIKMLLEELQNILRGEEYLTLYSQNDLVVNQIKQHLSTIPNFWTKGSFESLIDKEPTLASGERDFLKKIAETGYALFEKIGLSFEEPAQKDIKKPTPKTARPKRQEPFVKPPPRRTSKPKTRRTTQENETKFSRDLVLNDRNKITVSEEGPYRRVTVSDRGELTVTGNLTCETLIVKGLGKITVGGNLTCSTLTASDRSNITTGRNLTCSTLTASDRSNITAGGNLNYQKKNVSDRATINAGGKGTRLKKGAYNTGRRTTQRPLNGKDVSINAENHISSTHITDPIIIN